jgi:hypothetical protein
VLSLLSYLKEFVYLIKKLILKLKLYMNSGEPWGDIGIHPPLKFLKSKFKKLWVIHYSETWIVRTSWDRQKGLNYLKMRIRKVHI